MAKATAIFDADDSRLSRVISGIEKKLSRIAASVAGFGSGFAAAAGAVAAPAAAVIAILGGIGVGVKSALDTGGHFADLSANTGIAVKDLVVLEQEFKNAGKAAEDVGPAIGKMQKNIASGAAGGVLRQLGVDMEKLRQKSPVDQFHEIGAALNTLQDPVERASGAMEIFGKQGPSMLSMFSSAGFGDAAAQVGLQAELLNRDAALFDDVSDKLNLAGTKTKGFFVGVADKVAPILKPLLDGFAAIDLAKYGQAIGDAFAFIIQAISDGNLATIMSEALIIGAKEFGNALIGTMTAAAFGFGGSIVAAVEMLPQLLSVLTSYDFWAGLGNSLLAAGKAFIALMLDGVASVLQWLGKAPGLGKVGKAGDSVSGVAAGMHQSAKESMADANRRFEASPTGDFNEKLAESIRAIFATASEGYKLGASVFDSSGNRRTLESAVDTVMDHVAAQDAKSRAEVPTKKPPKEGWDQMLQKEEQLPVTALQRIGGNFGGGGTGDPLLQNAKRQTEYLREIAQAAKKNSKAERVEVVPAYG